MYLRNFHVSVGSLMSYQETAFCIFQKPPYSHPVLPFQQIWSAQSPLLKLDFLVRLLFKNILPILPS